MLRAARADSVSQKHDHGIKMSKFLLTSQAFHLIISGVEARVPIREQRLLHDQHPLAQTSTGGLGLTEGMKLRVVLRPDIEQIMMATEIVIFVKTLTGTTLTIFLPTDATIVEVMAKVFAQQGMSSIP